MKIKIFLLCVFTYTLYSCKSSSNQHTLYDEIGFTLYNGIEHYYYTYLEYPKSISDLSDFLWEYRINMGNNYKYSSFADYYSSNDSDKVRNIIVEHTIKFLEKNKHDLSISINKNKFVLDYFKKGKIKMELNYCNDKSTPFMNKFKTHTFHTFDSTGKITKEDYSDFYIDIKKKLVDKYPNYIKEVNKNGDLQPKYFLLKYQEKKGLSFLCDKDTIDLRNNQYIKEMLISLDSLINENHEIKSINFISIICYP